MCSLRYLNFNFKTLLGLPGVQDTVELSKIFLGPFDFFNILNGCICIRIVSNCRNRKKKLILHDYYLYNVPSSRASVAWDDCEGRTGSPPVSCTGPTGLSPNLGQFRVNSNLTLKFTGIVFLVFEFLT